MPILPNDEAELAAAVTDAVATKTPLAVTGGGTRQGYGRPVQAAETIGTAGLSGVTLYEPNELVLSAKAGTPLSAIKQLLATNRQRLAFEPPDFRRLYGSVGEPTAGGTASANLSGPRRIQAGAARDSLIGVRGATGRGVIVKSGGRVMKNVTGYDLVKFLAGSFGTLAVLSEVTFKVQPESETETTLVIEELDDAQAVEALSVALGSPFSVTGAAHISGASARTLIRLEGFAVSVADRAARLARQLARFGNVGTEPEETSRPLWAAIRDLDALQAPEDAPVWRVSVKPTAGPKVAGAVRAAFDARFLYDWGGGLLWIAGGTGEDAGAAVIRTAIRDNGGGHATLARADDTTRLSVAVFEPPSAPILELSRKLKQSFDPAGILNPGRMYPGI